MPRAVDGVIWACKRRAAAVPESTRPGSGSAITGRAAAVLESRFLVGHRGSGSAQ